MKNKTKSIWSRWYMIVLYCVAGLFFISLMIGSIASPDDSRLVETEKTEETEFSDSELIYVNDMLVYMDLFVIMTEIDSEISTGVVDRTISYSGASLLFGISADEYEAIEEELDEMDVPVKFRSLHNHFTNAVRYTKEACRLFEQGLGDFDIGMIDQRTIKLQQASAEMEQVTTILNAMNDAIN